MWEHVMRCFKLFTIIKTCWDSYFRICDLQKKLQSKMSNNVGHGGFGAERGGARDYRGGEGR